MLMGMETASGASTWKAEGEVWGQHLPILSAHPRRLNAVLCTDAAVSFHASVQLFFASSYTICCNNVPCACPTAAP